MITRFAPSPTGNLHLGGARTALFSWLLARHSKGKFILRIDDTDCERCSEEAEMSILRSLEWLNIDYDEIFYQSDRLGVYDHAIKNLILADKAYICHCTQEDLEESRQNQLINKLKVGYEGHCRDMKLAEDVPHVVRLKIPTDGQVSWCDGVLGEIVFENKELDDFIIKRSNGMPVYNFCSVVDDAEFQVTDIIRGSDHITNTAKQIHIFNAMQAAVPNFTHVPLILDQEGKKLSKRYQADDVMSFKDGGYMPLAVNNFLLRLGFAYENKEVFNTEEMIELFDIKRLGKSPARFDMNKLNWYNKKYMCENAEILEKSLGIKQHILLKAIEKSDNVLDIKSLLSFLQIPPIQEDFIGQEDLLNKDILQQTLRLLDACDFSTEASLWILLRDKIILQDVSVKSLGSCLRLGLTGQLSPFKIDEILRWLGKEESLHRIRQTLKFIIAH